MKSLTSTMAGDEDGIVRRLQVREDNGQTTVTIPRVLVLAKGWKNGDKVEFSINRTGDLVLKKVT